MVGTPESCGEDGVELSAILGAAVRECIYGSERADLDADEAFAMTTVTWMNVMPLFGRQQVHPLYRSLA